MSDQLDARSPNSSCQVRCRAARGSRAPTARRRRRWSRARRCARRGAAATRLTGSTAPIIGTKARPVANGDSPLTRWKYRLKHEDQSVERDIDEQADQRGQREHPVAEQRQRQHRLRRARFLPDEQKRRAPPRPTKPAITNGWSQPSAPPSMMRRRREQPSAAIAAIWPGRSISRCPMARGLAGIAPGQPQPGETDRQVDQKDRAPADQRDQRAADQRSRGQREARAGRPDADRTSARLLVGIGVAEQRQRIRHQDRRRQAPGRRVPRSGSRRRAQARMRARPP